MVGSGQGEGARGGGMACSNTGVKAERNCWRPRGRLSGLAGQLIKGLNTYKKAGWNWWDVPLACPDYFSLTIFYLN